MQDVKTFATYLITQLVDAHILGKEVNGAWVLEQPILGYEGNVNFKTREDLIRALVTTAMNSFTQSGSLKAAV